MKYVLAACVIVAGAAAVYFSNQGQQIDEADAHEQWRQSAVEAETRVRPAYFEDMKYKEGAEVRAPASTGKSKKK